MIRIPRRLLAALPLAPAVILLALPTAALAHERRTVGNGKYDVTVGWDVEPAYQGQKNGAGVRISQAGSTPAVPVTGAEKTLKIQIRQGAQTKELPLRAVFGQNGYYVADIVPERVGDYQFIFTGTINGDPVNETFDSADGKFNGVESIAPLQFPAGAGPESAAIQAAQQAQTLAYVGIGLGALGLLGALAALGLRGRGAGSAKGPAETPAREPAGAYRS